MDANPVAPLTRLVKGIDIKERKMTLPLIYTLNKADRATRKQIINVVKNDNQNAERVRWVIDTVRSYGGLEYAIDKMQVYRQEALQLLSTFPESEAKQSIEGLIEFTIERKI